MLLYAAPMQGLTTWIYRVHHSRMFGGIDRYFTPFFSPAPEHCVTPRDLRELCPEHNAGLSVVPQLMTRRPADFLWAAGMLADMGYREINLNLGCPSGTVTAKGKGAGLLADPAVLDRFFDEIFAVPPSCAVSVKTRLGIRDEGEFPRLLEIYNSCPLSELILHARVRDDFYRRPARPEAFAAAAAACRLPLCCNGDLITPGDCEAAAARFPKLHALMLARGLLADPALARKLRGGAPASREELQAFTAALYRDYRESYGPGPAVQRMKELWYYLIHIFDGGERYGGRMRRVSSPADYETLEAAIFHELPLRREALPFL